MNLFPCGHPRTPENSIVANRPYYRCAICSRAKWRAYVESGRLVRRQSEGATEARTESRRKWLAIALATAARERR